MNDKFHRLAKGLAQSLTRRQALRRLSGGLAGMLLAVCGMANRAEAAPGGCKASGNKCHSDSECCSGACIRDPEVRKPGYCL